VFDFFFFFYIIIRGLFYLVELITVVK